MEPIISPWLIYSISIVGNLWGLCGLACILFLFGAVVIRIEMNDVYNKEDLEKYKLWLKRSIALGIIFGLLSFFLPRKETYMAMIAASYATPDNIQAVQGNIVDFVGKLTEAVSQNMK